MIRRRFPWLLVFLSLPVIGSLALSPSPPPPVFRVGIQPWSGYAPGYQARSDGQLPSELVRLVELPTDAEIVRAMRSGALEAACMTLDGAFRVQAAGVDVRILAVPDYSHGADAIISVRGECQSLAELRGKRVAVERHGVGMLFLARILRTAGLRVNDIVVVNADMPEHDRLIAANRVDAVVTYSPHKERLVAAGGRALGDSTLIGGEVIDVLIVRTDAIANNPAAVRTLTREWLNAAERIQLDPGTHAPVAKVMGMTSGEFADGWRQLRVPDRSQNLNLVTGKPPGLLAAARETAATIAGLELLETRLDPVRLFLKPHEVKAIIK